MKVVIGCPVSNREWIMEHWFNYVDVAAEEAGVDHRFVFVGDPADPTFEVINRRAPDSTVVETAEERSVDVREWSTERKDKMVWLRNLLLAEVRGLAPDYFLSLDSDILIHPEAIRSMLEAFSGGWDAVGGKCYMTALPQGPAVTNPRSGTSCPSYLSGGRAGYFHRPDVEVPSLFRVDIIMAIKMMAPAAYNVDYAPHPHGEDIGWSFNARDAGLKLAWDARTISKHVMLPEHLHMLDARCGY